MLAIYTPPTHKIISQVREKKTQSQIFNEMRNVLPPPHIYLPYVNKYMTKRRIFSFAYYCANLQKQQKKNWFLRNQFKRIYQ